MCGSKEPDGQLHKEDEDIIYKDGIGNDGLQTHST